MFLLAPLFTLVFCLGFVAGGLCAAYGGLRLFRAGRPPLLFRPIGILAILGGSSIAALAAVETVRTVAFTVDFFHLI